MIYVTRVTVIDSVLLGLGIFCLRSNVTEFWVGKSVLYFRRIILHKTSRDKIPERYQSFLAVLKTNVLMINFYKFCFLHNIVVLRVSGRLGWCNGLQAWLANVHEWVRVLLNASFHLAMCHSWAESLVNYYFDCMTWSFRRTFPGVDNHFRTEQLLEGRRG